MEDPEQFIKEKICEIQKQIKGNAIIALSGGVDSAVCAELAHRAIGDRLYPIFINTGFMRKNETEQIKEYFSHMNLQVVNAEDRFFEEVDEIVDPEEKRKIIGKTFIKIFEEEAEKIDADCLIQGTIYTDVLESEKGIKSHHNVGGLPENMKFKTIVEPLYYLYKDDVREVAKALNLPKQLTERMPFPGPGLAIRVLGNITPEKIHIVREANAIVEEELVSKFKPWQTLAAIIGKGTGIKEGKRMYGWIIAIRAVKSVDAMTAYPLELPWETLDKLQKRLTEEVPGVARVVYDITPKPTGTIEFE
ncbi:MAG: glutamine-hydrolyzing GMP synthase subunit GuaA [Methanosarcinaceae archaeon]|nr:glutamine-hydrolyzing GMP synthase subunit GuaA [Methanosarcinaceae archaeon]